MSGTQVVGVFLSGVLLVAAISLIVQPGSTFGTAVSAIGGAISAPLRAATGRAGGSPSGGAATR